MSLVRCGLTNSLMQGDAPFLGSIGLAPARGLPRSAFRSVALHLLLFLLTLASTTQFGAALAYSFGQGRFLDEASLSLSYRWLFTFDRQLISGFTYSLPLLTILLAHEMGHYVACRRWNVDATLPFFGPSPTLLGTIGAFIWVRSPIYNRRTLFDIGVSGPICGFITLLPCLAIGIWQSRLAHSPHPTLISFGTPLLMRLLELLRFPAAPAETILLHPTAVAAWAGLLATAINLLPVGQLDGGHIVYAALGARWHAFGSLAALVGLAAAGALYWPWWLWAAALFFFRRHPAIYDDRPVPPLRRWLAMLAVVLLLLSFVPVPVRVA